MRPLSNASTRRELVAHIHKTTASERLGISFQKDSAPIYIGEGSTAHRQGSLPPLIHAVTITGLAAQARLSVGDMPAPAKLSTGDLTVHFFAEAKALGDWSKPAGQAASKGSTARSSTQGGGLNWLNSLVSIFGPDKGKAATQFQTAAATVVQAATRTQAGRRLSAARRRQRSELAATRIQANFRGKRARTTVVQKRAEPDNRWYKPGAQMRRVMSFGRMSFGRKRDTHPNLPAGAQRTEQRDSLVRSSAPSGPPAPPVARDLHAGRRSYGYELEPAAPAPSGGRLLRAISFKRQGKKAAAEEAPPATQAYSDADEKSPLQA
ncbi:hypothetical protein T492DRAFT_904277 [Pavlovales sp. CCMP2436]|nr:hypothetical protein T492DRAFT_904277 [Pavlovales sp. CCMP2436]